MNPSEKNTYQKETKMEQITTIRIVTNIDSSL